MSQYNEPGQAYYEDVPPPDYTEPYPPPRASLRITEPAPEPQRQPRWLAMFAFIASIVALGLAGYVMYGPKAPIDHTAARQIAALQQSAKTQGQELAGFKQALSKAQKDNASLSTKLASTQSKLSNLTAYTTECSAPVTAPSGNPAQAFFRCSYQRQ